MPSHHERIDFAPPPPSGQWRAIVLALLAHGLLIVALSVSLHWQRDSEDAAVEAELWSNTVMQAAPKPVAQPPAPVPPPPAPVAATPAPPPAPQTRDADIAIEKTRKQQELKRQQEEIAKQQAIKDKLAKDKAEKEKRDKAEKDKADKLAAQKREDDKRKDQAKREDQQAKVQEEKRRQDNIRRMQAMAGSGAEDATGNAQQSSGPSGSYQGKLNAILRPKVTFAGTISGNPKADIEVRTGPSGIVLSSRIVRSSGITAWDSAALAAVQKTDRLPSDNGRYYNPLIISFGPQD